MKTQCNCGQWWKWFVKPFGQTDFLILCSCCGKNATTAAEHLLGISSKYDNYDMAKSHLGLAQYERIMR